MTITNISNITEGALLTGANQMPFSIVVDNQQAPRAYISLQCDGNYLVENAELLCYDVRAPFFYFTIDIKDIVNSLFEDLDDTLQGEWSWQSMEDWIYDVTLTLTVTDGVNPDETRTIVFTVLNSATQINNDSRICLADTEYYDIDQNETLFVGEHNIGYAYVITALNDEVTTSRAEREYFVDSDDIYFTNYEDDYLYEI